MKGKHWIHNDTNYRKKPKQINNKTASFFSKQIPECGLKRPDIALPASS